MGHSIKPIFLTLTILLLWVLIVLVGPHSVAENITPPASPLENEVLFFDGFCCGNLDRWVRWEGVVPLDLYNFPGSLAWKNLYDFEASAGVASGQLPVQDYEVRIEMLRWLETCAPVCVVVRAATGEESYRGYRLRIEGEEAWLEKHSGNGSWQESTLQSQPLTVIPERFHHVRLQVYGAHPTRVRAKVWAQATAEPEAFQLHLEEDGESQILSGNQGMAVWFLVSGQRLEPYQTLDVITVRRLTSGW
jgi:hypothetical protein